MTKLTIARLAIHEAIWFFVCNEYQYSKGAKLSTISATNVNFDGVIHHGGFNIFMDKAACVVLIMSTVCPILAACRSHVLDNMAPMTSPTARLAKIE